MCLCLQAYSHQSLFNTSDSSEQLPQKHMCSERTNNSPVNWIYTTTEKWLLFQLRNKQFKKKKTSHGIQNVFTGIIRQYFFFLFFIQANMFTHICRPRWSEKNNKNKESLPSRCPGVQGDVQFVWPGKQLSLGGYETWWSPLRVNGHHVRQRGWPHLFPNDVNSCWQRAWQTACMRNHTDRMNSKYYLSPRWCTITCTWAPADI